MHCGLGLVIAMHGVAKRHLVDQIKHKSTHQYQFHQSPHKHTEYAFTHLVSLRNTATSQTIAQRTVFAMGP